MRIVLSRQLADLPVHRAQWNALVAETAGATVFQTYEWFECWWTAFGAKLQLCVVTLWDGALLVGIAQLFKARYTRKRRTNANLRAFSRRWLYLAVSGAIRAWSRLPQLRRAPTWA